MNNEVDIDQIRDPIELVYLFFDKMGIPSNLLRRRFFKSYGSFEEFVFDVFLNSNSFNGISGHFKRMFVRKVRKEDKYIMGGFDPFSFQWDMIEWSKKLYPRYFNLIPVDFEDVGLKYVSRFHAYFYDGGKINSIERRPLTTKIEDGDLVFLGNHRVRCGDCIKYISEISDIDNVKMIYTDPPYGVNVGEVMGKGDFDKMSNVQLFELLFNLGLKVKELFRDKGKNIPVFLWKGYKLEGHISTFAFLSGLFDKSGISYLDAMKLFSKNYSTSFYWVKTASSNSQSKKFWSSIEPMDMIMTCGEYEGKAINFDNYIIYFRPSGSYGHASMKPVFINSFIMNLLTNKGDLVLDLFGGSGSTLLSAMLTGRRAYLIEKSPEFVEYIISRWQAYRRWKGLSTDVFIVRNGKMYKNSKRFDEFVDGDNVIDIERKRIFESKNEMEESYKKKYGKI